MRILICIVFLTLCLPVGASAQSGTPCNQFQSGTPTPAGYGAAWSPFGAKALLLNSYCSGSAGQPVEYRVGTNNATHYVYKLGYVYTSAWSPFTMTGTFAQGSTEWLARDGVYKNNAPPASNHFWVGYLCGWDGTRWLCGCRDEACATPYWQLQGVAYAGGGTAAGATGGTTGGGSCSSTWNGTPCPPQAPRSYTLPSGGLRVTDAASFKSALSGSSARDIILENGTYDNSGPFVPGAAHRIWAASLGGATLKAGIDFRNGAGGEVHGIRFDVNDQSKGAESSIIHNSGSGSRLVITDVWLEGRGIMDRGVLIRAIDGVKMQRLYIRNFRRDGIRIADPDRGEANPPVYISDVDVANVVHPDPACCNGTAEDGVWLGTTGTVERVKARNIDWMCVVSVTLSFNSKWRDLDLDGCSTGVYLEHRTAYTTVERFIIGASVRNGVNFEGGQDRWNIDDSRWNWKAIGPGNTIQDGTINSTSVGVNVAPCNAEATVQRVTFRNQCSAAIWNGGAVSYGPCPAPRPGGGTSADSNVFRNNNYSGIDAGADPIRVTTFHSQKCQ